MPAPPAPGWQPRGTAELQVLDKVRAQATTVSVKAGGNATVGSLTIGVRSCYARPPDQPADSTAFLEVSDSRPTGAGFRGWMLAGAPALNVMQHPIYDVRLVSCR